ncbi:MAG TPA: tRNA (guanosine(37)-N1)-methyltransferase TrmD [Candidatus Omnitrophota bacterium]|nr:tRNA (guanosine(37)-N1)-methyltransferase TrmD [Candidatus Omnitrophota bacterium]HPD85022.1 tRNA (guanosine(37)-N1)-methyltransferase TrmD [Candidatus Omnitrophota bacterium]HRZ03880.1 tRNA (guanosine(37)-N1)-methyltransferase TrmD [Candidatus Omnitrophota bacterium]
MRVDVITIFPKSFSPVLNESIVKRAQEKKRATIEIHDLRDYTSDKHRKVDDRPFGGGPGMVMGAQPVFDAIKKIKGAKKAKVILMCPTGRPLTQNLARKLARLKHMIIICGHYEGMDERIREKLVDESISVGDYILTGGELPAMILIDCVVRLVPGVLGKPQSLSVESFEDNLLEYPQYTRPANFRGMAVPNVLLSGNHEDINKWRIKQSIERTKKLRPDLFKKYQESKKNSRKD